MSLMKSFGLQQYILSRTWLQASSKIGVALSSTLVLAACAVLPNRPDVPVTYDFGSLSGEYSSIQVGDSRPALVLIHVKASGLPNDAQALQYRQSFALDQRLQSYQLARWSQQPSALFTQQLRSVLQGTRPILDESLRLSRTSVGGEPAVLQTDIMAFEQIFDAANSSAGHVQVQATLLQSNSQGNTLLGQKVFFAKIPAQTPDAAGGAKAIAEAAKIVADNINAWVTELGK